MFMLNLEHSLYTQPASLPIPVGNDKQAALRDLEREGFTKQASTSR